MRKTNYKKIIAILSLGLLVVLTNCTRSVEFIEPPTKLRVQILTKDKSGKSVPVRGVQIGIFSDSNIYNQARPFYNFISADYKFNSDENGFVTFDSVKSNVRYYVLCKFDSLINGVDEVTFSNVTDTYQFLNPLKNNTLTTAIVYISASDGYINFWTKNTFVTQEPISVLLGKDTIAKVSQYDLQGGSFPLGTKTMKLRAGKYTYSAKSKDSICAWIDTIQVAALETKNEELVICNSYKVTVGVTASTTSQIAFPIKVVLNKNDTIGVLNKPMSATNPSCGAANAISISKRAGIYNYQFIDANNTVKVGSFIIGAPVNGSLCNLLIVNY